ncbi:MAG: anti-sigma-I factor RsgI family protein [Christensenellales bacterium]|jgi:hypothetical protein
MTYMVMETHKSYCVVLDEEGRFLKAANMGYETGQKVQNIIPMRDYQEKRAIPVKAMTAIVSLAACFVLIFTVLLNSLAAVHGSVYLTINPAVRADVGKNGIVVSLTPLNDDAVTLLDGYNGKRKPLTTLSKELVDRAIERGFLSEGGAVVIDIDSPDDVWFEKTGITLRKNLNEHIEGRLSVTIEIKQYSEDAGTQTPPPAPPKTEKPIAPTTPSPSALPQLTRPPQPANTKDDDSGHSDYDDDEDDKDDGDSGYSDYDD